MSAPQTNGAAAHNNGPIDQHDMEDWTKRFNEVFGNLNEHINAPEVADARDWNSAFCGCLNPIDQCCITYFCPCITFGKIHHRTRKNGSLEGYEPINTSCLLFLASMFLPFGWVIPEAMQRADIRKKYGLKGTCMMDIPIACCCALCDLTQQNKEAEFREQEKGGSAQQYKQEANGMTYAPQA